MSVIGSNAAASVAQTTVQAQDVAQRRDKSVNESARTATRSREIRDALLSTVEDPAHDDTAQLSIHEQQPDQRNPQQSQPQPDDQQSHKQATPQAQAPQDAPSSQAPSPATPPQPPGLYHHVDVEA